MLARVQALQDVGGFDHRYFLCFEEMDLARRMADAGWTVALCADAWATHHAQHSRSQVPRFSNYHKYRSQRLYLERWYGAAAARRYARLATLAWRARKVFRKIDDADFRLLAAAVGGAEMP
jgi:GT2 family glycosyltransferase